MAGLNEEVRSRAHRSQGGQSYAFVCECGDEDCDAHFRLELSLFDSLRRSGVALLADGHPVSRTRKARREARELQESARALDAQPHLQVNRARLLRAESFLVVVQVPTAEAGSDLVRQLREPALVSERAHGVEVTIELERAVADTLGHVQDWARGYGLDTVDVTLHGATRTLIT